MSKFNKDIVPKDFTLPLVLVDTLPVIAFSFNIVLLGMKLKSIFFIIGALICVWAGLAKVIWKLIVVLKQKNIWFLFMQMRIFMPTGFICMIIGMVLNHNQVNWSNFTSFPSILFFIIGLFGMCLMMVFAKVLDSGNLKANWIEQITNAIAQFSIFLGLLYL